MRNAYYILVISTILTTSSCQKENDGISTTAPNKKIEINTSIANTSSLSSSVKSPQLNEDGSGNFANGDEITLHVLSESGEATIIKYGVGTTILARYQSQPRRQQCRFLGLLSPPGPERRKIYF